MTAFVFVLALALSQSHPTSDEPLVLFDLPAGDCRCSKWQCAKEGPCKCVSETCPVKPKEHR